MSAIAVTATSAPDALIPLDVIPLDVAAHVDWRSAGSRGERLARAARMNLPVPAGAIIPSGLLGTRSHGTASATCSAGAIDTLFGDLADEGN